MKNSRWFPINIFVSSFIQHNLLGLHPFLHLKVDIRTCEAYKIGGQKKNHKIRGPCSNGQNCDYYVRVITGPR